MSNTAALLSKLVSTEALSTIGKTAKVSKNDVQKVLTNALPVLLTGMQNNAGTKEGAQSLTQALTAHAADNTDDITAFLQNADAEDGKKILAHILGDENEAVQKAVATRAGVSKNKTSLILAIAAPLLLSLLGQSNDNSSSAGIGNLIGSLLGTGNSNSGLGGVLLSSLLGGNSNSNNGLGGALLGSLLGGNDNDNSNSLGGALLGSLLGGNDSSEDTNDNPAGELVGTLLGNDNSNSGSDLGGALLGSLLGGNSSSDDNGSDLGGALLGALLGSKNKK